MSLTTIKVDTVTRDKLSSAARKRGVTIGALMAEIADRVEREQLFVELHAAYARLQETPAEWAAYLAEGREWGDAPLDALPGDARAEFPELLEFPEIGQ